MSGLEALGLACNIFQVISFARDTVQVCQDIYDGQKHPDSHLQDVSKAMREAADKVEKSSQSPSTPEEQSLADIAKKCIPDVKRLDEYVAKINTRSNKGRFIGPLKARVSSHWGKRTIGDLERNLKGYRDAMQHLMITDA